MIIYWRLRRCCLENISDNKLWTVALTSITVYWHWTHQCKSSQPLYSEAISFRLQNRTLCARERKLPHFAHIEPHFKFPSLWLQIELSCRGDRKERVLLSAYGTLLYCQQNSTDVNVITNTSVFHWPIASLHYNLKFPPMIQTTTPLQDLYGMCINTAIPLIIWLQYIINKIWQIKSWCTGSDNLQTMPFALSIVGDSWWWRLNSSNGIECFARATLSIRVKLAWIVSLLLLLDHLIFKLFDEKLTVVK